MKIILLRDITRLGQRGDIKEVADGYAMNVLIKKGDAIQATPAELTKWKQKEEVKKYKKELETSAFAQLIDTLHREKIIISGKKADTKGQLFAQIKEGDVAEAIFKVTTVSIDPKQIIIETHIKSLGTHAVLLKQGTRQEKIDISVE